MYLKRGAIRLRVQIEKGQPIEPDLDNASGGMRNQFF